MKDYGLSVCIIAKNEEKNLPDCLESVQPAASEIIVVDTGSDDRTMAVAEEFGCRVYRTEWNDDFAAARNEALSYATQPFILSIDADERLVTPGQIEPLLKESSLQTGGWLVEVSSEVQRKAGKDKFVSNLLRLFRNDENIRFSGIIHEQVTESVINLGLGIENSPVKIIHHGYDSSPQDLRYKQLRNLKLLDKALENDPEHAYTLFQRAKTYLALDRWEEAEHDIQQAIEKAPSGGTVKPQALNYGGIIAYRLDYLKNAEERAKKSLELLPKQAFANFILGEVYLTTNNFDKAYDAFSAMEKALAEPDPLSRIVGDYYLPPEQLHFKKGKCLIGLKLFDEALAEFKNGVDANPKHSACLVGMANAAYKKKRYGEAANLLKRAVEIDPADSRLNKFLRQVQVKLDEQEQTELNFEEKPAEGQQKPLLSLSMIVKDEEDMLAGCLDSVKDIADEIVIVDTGSTDKTKEIAQQYGAKLYDFDWVDDFSAARNESLKRCAGEWILYMDADERLDKESAKDLRDFLANSPDSRGGYFCTIESDHSQLDGKAELHRGGYPRIFRNYGYPKIQFQGRVHEQITPSILDLGANFEFSDVIINHLGYNQPREVMEEKIKRNYKMLIEHVQDEPLNGYAWFQLGQTLAQMKLNDEAEKSIRLAVQTGSLSDSVYASAAAVLAQLTGNKKNFEETLHWAEESLKSAPEQIYALHLRAYAHLYLDNFDQAEKDFHEVRNRLKNSKGVPKSGFDIVIPEEVVDQGLRELEQRRAGGS